MSDGLKFEQWTKALHPVWNGWAMLGPFVLIVIRLLMTFYRLQLQNASVNPHLFASIRIYSHLFASIRQIKSILARILPKPCSSLADRPWHPSLWLGFENTWKAREKSEEIYLQERSTRCRRKNMENVETGWNWKHFFFWEVNWTQIYHACFAVYLHLSIHGVMCVNERLMLCLSNLSILSHPMTIYDQSLEAKPSSPIGSSPTATGSPTTSDKSSSSGANLDKDWQW